MASTMNHLVGLHLDGSDGLWEIACSPHSWLPEATELCDLQPRRINLASGFDLRKADTLSHLKALRQSHRPRRLWFSLPCARWCQWNNVNFNTPEKKEVLETASIYKEGPQDALAFQ